MMLFVRSLPLWLVAFLPCAKSLKRQSIDVSVWLAQIVPYILSGSSAYWCLCIKLLLFKELAVDIPGGLEVAIGLYITLFLATLAGMMMGLLVSAVSPNPHLSISIPIPQITFGGGLANKCMGCQARLLAR